MVGGGWGEVEHFLKENEYPAFLHVLPQVRLSRPGSFGNLDGVENGRPAAWDVTFFPAVR